MEQLEKGGGGAG